MALLRLVAARIATDDAYTELRGEHGVAVLYRYDSKHPGRQVIAGEDVDGELSIEAFRGPARQARLDSFDLQLFCGVGPNSVELDHSDPIDPAGFHSLDAQVMRLVQVVDDVVATSPRLDDDGSLGSLMATMSALKGPNATETNEGPGSGAIVTVHMQTHHR